MKEGQKLISKNPITSSGVFFTKKGHEYPIVEVYPKGILVKVEGGYTYPMTNNEIDFFFEAPAPEPQSFGVLYPIEDAPKDGTWVLLFGGETTEEDYLKEGVLKTRPVVAFFNKDCMGWSFCYWDGAWREGYENPTHYTPLPKQMKL